MSDLFSKLDDEGFFVEFVGNHLTTGPEEICAIMACSQEVDEERLQYAYKEYQQIIQKFALYLNSSNPDHYKRAAALLHALYSSDCIVSVDLETCADELESGFTRVTANNAEHLLPFAQFFEAYHNEMLAFELAFRVCASYEAEPVNFDFDYIQNVCRYLKTNENIAVDSLFIMFKSLMYRK